MTRHDGRLYDQLRHITIQPDFTKAPHASVLVSCGDTIVWCSASVEESVPRWLEKEQPGKGWVTAEYMMLPASTTPRSSREGRRGQISGRTQEIQRLIGRSLRAAIDLKKLGPRTITLDCEVLQADGGTRTTSITGAFVALALACKKLHDEGKITELPLNFSVAAVSVGLVDDKILLDLPYVEDVAAAVDMNVVMTGSGRFIEIQGTGEESTFSEDEFNQLLALARKGIRDLTALQWEALGDDPYFASIF